MPIAAGRTDSVRGDAAAAIARLRKFGPNELLSRRELAAAVPARFRNPLALLLLGASAIAAPRHEVMEYVVRPVTLDFVRKAGRAAERLRQKAAAQVRVVSDGDADASFGRTGSVRLNQSDSRVAIFR